MQINFPSFIKSGESDNREAKEPHVADPCLSAGPVFT